MRNLPRQGKKFLHLATRLESELEIANKQRSPLIVLALYRSEHVVSDVERYLVCNTGGLADHIIRFRVDEERANIIRFIEPMEVGHSLISVIGLRYGGGADQANAYRELNLHREYFIENKIRILIWLTEEELIRLTNYAPDFWAFRHLFVDFSPLKAAPKRLAWFEACSWREWPLDRGRTISSTSLTDMDKKIQDLPNDHASLAIKCKLLSSRATLNRSRGRTVDAIRDLETALEIASSIGDSPLSELLRVCLGIVYAESGEFTNARRIFSQALALSPSVPGLLCEFGELNRQEGRRSEALKLLEKAVRNDPDDAKIWNDLGNVFFDLGRPQAARTAYEKAVSLAPDKYAPLYNLGMLLVYLEQDRAALTIFRKLPDIIHQDPKSWIERGRILFRLGQFGEAISAFQIAEKLEPDNLYTKIAQAACIREFGRPVEASQRLKAIRPTLESESEYLQALYASANLDSEKALELLGKALQKKQIRTDHIFLEPCLKFLSNEPGIRRIQCL